MTGKFILTAFKDYDSEGIIDVVAYPIIVGEETIKAIVWLLSKNPDSTLKCTATEVTEP